jgi:hypothetical protein
MKWKGLSFLKSGRRVSILAPHLAACKIFGRTNGVDPVNVLEKILNLRRIPNEQLK